MLDNLNKEQKKAVMCTEGPLLVFAGAGSGKTRVITRRIAYLVKEKGVDPYNILAITFTNKAAREMKTRVDKLLDGRTQGMIISTFHSACVRVLRREINKLGYTSNFNIYDTGDSTSILKTIIKELNFSDNKYNPKMLLAKFGTLKDETIGPDEYLDRYASNFFEVNVGKAYKEYQNRLKRNNAIDFDDIICLTVKLLSEFKHVRSYYQDRFKYILVDEYQDTNKMQFKLIELLTGERRNLCVVGDDDQSIFMWRGANIENILSFEKSFKGANVVKLEQNYRSTAKILAVANDIIKHNYSRKAKKLWTDKDGGENLKVYKLSNEYHEGRFITEEIRRFVGNGRYKYSDFAVLYRMNVQSRNIEDSLMSSGIPYKIFGGLKFYDRKEVKDVLAYLRLIYNESDMVAFERAISIPKRGIGQLTINKVLNASVSSGKSVLEIIKEASFDVFSAVQRKNLSGFSHLIESIKESSLSKLPSEIIGDIIEKTKIIEEYERIEPLEYEMRVDNIRELVSIALQQEKDGITTLDEFLEGVSLVSDVTTDEESDSFVSLMTLHSAKGLEFPVIFMAGFEEGIFPSEKSSMEPLEMEEERRLCYVGITRAMELLYMTYTSSRTIYGRTSYSRISRFFNDIDEERVDHDTGIKAETKKIEVERFIRKPIVIHRKDDEEYSEGDRVIHKRFGIGKIVAISKEDNDTIIEIEFNDKKKRRFVAAYANLEKM